MANRYPGAIWRRSVISHADRPRTLGIVMHWTVGREAGDITVLDGPNVDCQFYVAKDGDVYQFLETGEQGWHAKRTANTYCIGIEHELLGGEPYTDRQLAASSRLVAWLCDLYAIPVVHADPSGTDLSTFRGIFGHRDLSLGGIRVDGNDHTDTVPDDPGWAGYLRAVNDAMGIASDPVPDLAKLPFSGSLRLVLTPTDGRQRVWAGWEDAAGAILWVAREGLRPGTQAAISYRGAKADSTGVWRGPEKVTAVCRNIARNVLGAEDARAA